MYKPAILAFVFAVSACAHQGGDSSHGNKRAERFDDREQTSDQARGDTRECQDLGPSMGRDASGRSMGITDCDVIAVDRAASRLDRDTLANPLQDNLGQGLNRGPALGL